jgi:general secretion pathway protein A
MEQIARGIAQREAVTVLTGPTGIGKTLLCQAIPGQLDRRTLTSLVLSPIRSFDDLLERLLADFGVLSREELVAARDRETSKRVNTLGSFLSSLASLRANAVIVVDEAQDVACDVLAALAALAASNADTVQIVLVGQPALRHLLDRPELRALAERVGRRLELGPLASDELPGYVMHRIHVAGSRIDFDDAALALVFALSNGVPRVVNQICERAVARALRRSSTLVDAPIAIAAAEELGMSRAPPSGGALRTITIGLVFLLLMSAGAGAAAWVFRDRVQRIVAQWHTPPQPRR